MQFSGGIDGTTHLLLLGLLLHLNLIDFALLSPVSELRINAFFVLILNIIAIALLGLSWLWVEAKSLRVALNGTRDVVLHSKGLSIHVVEASWGAAFDL